MHIVFDTSGLKLDVRNDCLAVQTAKGLKLIHPSRIESITVTGGIHIHTRAMILASDAQIPIYVCNRWGHPEAILLSSEGSTLTDRKRKQVVFASPSHCLETVLRIFREKGDGQIRHLRWMAAHRPALREQINNNVELIVKHLDEMSFIKPEATLTWRQSIMGLEGAISRKYWAQIGVFLDQIVLTTSRSRRPALDPYNAMLNYVYGMLYQAIHLSVLRAGLDPSLGFMHADGGRRPSLVFDLIEPWRAMADMFLSMVLTSGEYKVNWCVEKDGGWRLSSAGKKILIPAYNRWMDGKGEWLGHRGRRKSLIQQYMFGLANQIDQIDIPQW